MKKNIKITDTYKLPWSEFDNPNGWIEPLSKCNIVCPGCYRGSDKKINHGEMLPLDELKKQIDWFKQHRNVHTISIAGGEPTLYPNLRELIAYAAQQNLRTMLFTNGLLLTKELALELASVGLNQVVIHVDRFQNRPDMISITANELRQKFVNVLKDIPNLQIGFIQPISEKCQEEVASLIKFLDLNFNYVNLTVFSIYRNICESSEYKPEIENKQNLTSLLSTIQKYAPIEPSAYLSSKNDNSVPTWLFTQRMGISGKIFGNVSASLYKLAHQKYRSANKRFLFVSRTNKLKVTQLLPLVFNFSAFKILINYIFHSFKTWKWNKGEINFQTFLLLRGPEKQNGKWDLCDGCPDRMIYNGKIVPSCILENIKEQQNDEFNNVNI